MYVTDYGNHVVRQVTPDATVTTFAGSGTAGSADGVGPAASFSGPRGIAYCPKDKSLYVADRDNNEIRKITMDGTVSTFAGTTSVGFVDGPVAARVSTIRKAWRAMPPATSSWQIPITIPFA